MTVPQTAWCDWRPTMHTQANPKVDSWKDCFHLGLMHTHDWLIAYLPALLYVTTHIFQGPHLPFYRKHSFSPPHLGSWDQKQIYAIISYPMAIGACHLVIKETNWWCNQIVPTTPKNYLFQPIQWLNLREEKEWRMLVFILYLPDSPQALGKAYEQK